MKEEKKEKKRNLDRRGQSGPIRKQAPSPTNPKLNRYPFFPSLSYRRAPPVRSFPNLQPPSFFSVYRNRPRPCSLFSLQPQTPNCQRNWCPLISPLLLSSPPFFSSLKPPPTWRNFSPKNLSDVGIWGCVPRNQGKPAPLRGTPLLHLITRNLWCPSLDLIHSKLPPPSSPEATTAVAALAISLHDSRKGASSLTTPLTSPEHSASRRTPGRHPEPRKRWRRGQQHCRRLIVDTPRWAPLHFLLDPLILIEWFI
jgi:hypothetical protein